MLSNPILTWAHDGRFTNLAQNRIGTYPPRGPRRVAVARRFQSNAQSVGLSLFDPPGACMGA